MHAKPIHILIAITLAVGAWGVSPATAHASVISDLQTQLAELLAKVFTLKAQLQRLTDRAADSAGDDTRLLRRMAPDLSCLILPRNLAYGDRGYDVTQLQLFLAKDSYIYPEAAITGAFDLATQRAVQRYQIANGIVAWGSPKTTGFGVVGPKTRAAMARGCETLNATTTATSTPTEPALPAVLTKDLNVRQVFGGAPFNVRVSFELADSCYSYAVDWGDGSAGFEKYYPPEECDGEPRTVRLNHVYPRNGTYTMYLRAGKAKTRRQLALQLPVVSYKTVVVGEAVVPFSLDTTEGPAPLTVNAEFTLTHPACTSYQIDWGDGNADQFEVSEFACSRNPKTFRIKHIYDTPGTYEVTFRSGAAAIADLPVRERWVVDVSDLVQGSAVVHVSESAGPAPLTVEVRLAGTDGYCTSYEIDWGDGSGRQRKEFVAQENSEFSVDDFVIDQTQGADPYADCSGNFERTFTHTYVTYGTYPLKIKFGRGPLADIKPVTHWVSVFLPRR